MKKPKNGTSAISIDKLIFVFGGSHRGVSVNTIEKYIIPENFWSVISIKLMQPVHDTICFYLGGARVLIFGGI